MAEEIELKLSASLPALAAARTHPAVAATARGRLRTQQILSEYYDTAERDLAASGVALRLRHIGARWLQAVKGDGRAAGGVHRRAEFEWRLAGPQIDFAKLEWTPWRKLFARIGNHYQRVFVTAVRRSELPLAFADGTRATLCFDVGEIRAGRRRAAVNEIEVELEQGDPLRLFELAAALVADLPLRVMHASKAERGYALGGATAPTPRRAREVVLAAEATPQAALAAVGAECVSQIEVNAEAMLSHEDAEYLHQLRVGWRRLRSLLKLVAQLGAADAIAPLEQELGWLGSILGPARDYDVLVLETLPELAALFRGQRAISRLRRRAMRRRRELAALAREAVATPRFQKLLLALGAFFITLDRASSPVPILIRDWVCPLLQRRHDQLSKRARYIHRMATADRHRARVAAKKLRYAAEFFAPLFPRKRGAVYITALSRLQSILGRLNDLETAGKLLEELSSAADPTPENAHAAGIVRGWLAASAAPEIHRLRAAQRTFGKSAPFWAA